MDRFDGLCVQITKYWDGDYISFKNSNDWTWKFSDKSFRKAKLTELPDYVPSEKDYKYLIPIWKKLKII